MINYSLDNRVIRVFISSTFRDMQDERDELMKKTFPILRHKAADRDVTLTELDLRWGITPEESQSGKVVEICLREIENSKPFFVGIIGNRYGWIPSADDLGESLRERFSQVDGYVERQLSVTEMEMQFGVLERPEDLHAFFFIKEQEADDVDEPQKLAALKSAVRSNGRYPVSTYSSPEDLAHQVEEAFTKLLDKLYPEGALSELEKERIGQRAYLNSLCQNYIRTNANFATIDEWMADWDKHQLVITGASGLGKSALVANWVKEKLVTGDGLPYRIIYHFVGNGGSLGSHGHVIKTLCDEIRDRYDFIVDENDDKADEKALEELFNRVAAEGDKPLLVILDAINQIIDIDNSKQLNWLPIPPKKVKILFTTLEDDRTMEVFKNRHYPVFTLQPLTKGQRAEMVKGYLGLYSKKLQPHQVERIVTDMQCENTLVLKTLLDELVNFGIFEKLDEKIGTYLGAASVEEFYGILLKGYEADFGETLVKHVLSLIAVSRNGLSEEEILAITQETPLHWSQFFCAIRQHLIVKNGLISFAHSYIRKAVEERYLQGREDWSNACRKEIVSFFNNAKTHRAMDEVPFQYNKLGDLKSLHGYLMDLEVFAYLKRKEETTLGGYWRALEEGGYSLKDYLLLLEALPSKKKVGILSILSNFTRTIVVNPSLSILFIENALKDTEDNMTKAVIYSDMGLSYSLTGDYQKALEFHRKALLIRQELFGDNHPETAISLDQVGLAYGDLGDKKMALEYHIKALDVLKGYFSDTHPDVALSYNNVGAAYSDLGDNKKALKYCVKALKVQQCLYGDIHPLVANSYNNIGVIYGFLGNHKQSLANSLKALQIQLNLFGDYHPAVATSYDNIGVTYSALGDSQKSLEFIEKALKIRLSLFGESHPDVATSYKNLGRSYGKLGEYRKALKNELNALDILQHIYGDAPNPEVAATFSTIADMFSNLGDYNYALESKLIALGMMRDLYGDHDSNTADCFYSVGILYCKIGEYQKAIKYLHKALDTAIQIGDENSTATYYNHVGRAYKAAGQQETANDYFRQAAKKFRELGDEEQAVANLKEVVVGNGGCPRAKDM